jgi:membrane-associated phospholipid phosphatase
MTGEAYTAPALAQRRRPQHPGSAGRADGLAVPLGVAGACVVVLALIWVAAAHVPAARSRDAIALHELTLLNRPTVESVGSFLIHLLDPLPFVIWGGALVLTALARGMPRVAIAVAAILMLAPFSAEVLKPLVGFSHVPVDGSAIGPASWPSGHSTAAVVLVLSLIAVAPRRVRVPVAIIGVAYVAAVSFALLVLAWHMPSDVLGGYFLGLLWGALAVFALRVSERMWPSRVPRREETTPIAA